MFLDDPRKFEMDVMQKCRVDLEDALYLSNRELRKKIFDLAIDLRAVEKLYFSSITDLQKN